MFISGRWEPDTQCCRASTCKIDTVASTIAASFDADIGRTRLQKQQDMAHVCSLGDSCATKNDTNTIYALYSRTLSSKAIEVLSERVQIHHRDCSLPFHQIVLFDTQVLVQSPMSAAFLFQRNIVKATCFQRQFLSGYVLLRVPPDVLSMSGWFLPTHRSLQDTFSEHRQEHSMREELVL